ncbi:ATP-binding protein [Stenotrophomonas indicatrix]|uniref:AAA family ATPase n=2 Tax=Stenotrophomonas indicatrix TaxID=2045451 RepID=UPI002FDD80F7
MNKNLTNQQIEDLMAQNELLRSEIVQIARLGAKGDAERLRIQVVRLSRRLRAEGDELADLLQTAVFGRGDGVPQGITRSANSAKARYELSAPVPTDAESRMELLRVESSPSLPHRLVQSEGVMRQLQSVISERGSMARLAKLNLLPTKTVLFTGPPGVGKTLAAKHLAVELGRPLLVLDLASVISSFLGRTGNNIKQAFDFAKRSPCILFLDELDAVAKRRDDEADVGELKRLVTVLLQEIDLWPHDNLLIAATNHANLLDPAVWRRFDRTIEFPRPDAATLIALSEECVPKGEIPEGWLKALASIAQGTSQSDFLRDVNRVRRAVAIGGKKEGTQTISEIIEDRSTLLKMSDRKIVAVSLVKDVGLSQREASKLSGIARETLRTALQG